MGLLKSQFARSFLSAFSTSRRGTDLCGTTQLQHIQASMLDALGSSTFERTTLRARILAADDMQQLWYLRCNVMQAISADHSEAEARAILVPITALFDEVVPSSMHSRSSPEQRRQQHIKETAQGFAG